MSLTETELVPVRQVCVAVLALAFSCAVFAGVAGAQPGWKKVLVLGGRASVSVPASWPRDHLQGFDDYLGYLDGRGNLAINQMPYQASPTSFKKLSEAIEQSGYRGTGAQSTFRKIRIAGVSGLEYVVIYRRHSFEQMDVNYYFQYARRAYSFSYNCFIRYATALRQVFARSAASIRVR